MAHYHLTARGERVTFAARSLWGGISVPWRLWDLSFGVVQGKGNVMKVWIGLVVVAVLCFGCVHADASEPGGGLKVALVTGGHDFDKKTFLGLFDSLDGIEYVHLPQRDHSEVFEDIDDWPYDVIVLYNMTQQISEKRRKNFVALLDRGVGLVALHHAIASFQEWPEYRKIIGSKYYLSETVEGGVTHPGSGYKHDVDFTIEIEDSRHPVTRGLNEFRVHDETYNKFSCDPGNRVLLTTDHPAADKPVCWVKTYRDANVCYIQMGHGTSIFADESYRRLVAQSIKWAASKKSG